MIEFEVKGMSCGHCVGAITKAVMTLDPKAEVKVDLPRKNVAIESMQSRSAIAAALIQAGYPPA